MAFENLFIFDIIWLSIIQHSRNYDFFAVGTASQIPQTASRRKIWGIIGTIRLLACRYMIVITEAERVGSVAGQNIFKIVATEILPYSRSLLHLSEKQIQNNTTYLEMIKLVLNEPYFYFSYTYDLSHTMQRLHNTPPEFLQVIPIIMKRIRSKIYGIRHWKCIAKKFCWKNENIFKQGDKNINVFSCLHFSIFFSFIEFITDAPPWSGRSAFRLERLSPSRPDSTTRTSQILFAYYSWLYPFFIQHSEKHFGCAENLLDINSAFATFV